MKKKIAKKKRNFIPIHTGLPELVPINSIVPWKDNPRRNDKAVERLAALIKKHGVRSPVTCWVENRVIYKGNTTYKALKLLKSELIPVVWQQFPSEAAAIAYGISDNKSSEYSEWDDGVLLQLMLSEDIQEHKQETGFRESELSKLILKSTDDKSNKYEERLPKIVIIHHPDVGDTLKDFLSKVLKRFGDKVIMKEG